MRSWKAGEARGKQFAGRGVGVLCLDTLNLRYILSRVPGRDPIQSSLSKELPGSLTGSPIGMAGFRDAVEVMRTHAFSPHISPFYSFSLNVGFFPI